jgi:O-antigen/teichoic acid export membrane protein
MKQLAKNFLSLASSEIARKILGFLSVAFLARRLSLADFGLVSLGYTILSYTINISTAGLNLYGIKETAHRSDNSLVGRLLSLRLAIASVVFILTALVSILFVRDPVMTKLIIAFNCSLFAYAFLLEWHFQGTEEMNTISFGKSVTAAVYLVLILLLVRSDRDVLWVAVASVVGDFVMMLFYYMRYRREGNVIDLDADRAAWKLMIQQSLPLGFGTVLGQISSNLAPLIIAVMMTNDDVGLYSAASKLVVFLLLFDRVLGVLLLPASARLRSVAPGQLSPRLGEALRWILLAALPICVGGTLLSNDIIHLVFGDNFAAAGGLFRILIWFLCFTMIHTVFNSGLVAVAPSRVYGRVMSISAIVYVLSITILTKLYGLNGAVFGVVLSEGFTLLTARASLRPYLSIKTSVPIHWVLTALIVMTIAVLALQPYGVILRVIVGALLYFSVLVLLRVCTLGQIADLVWRKST